MKKIFTLLALALTSMSMLAKDYTCPLTVNVNGAEMPVGNVSVSVDEQSNGKYTLSLRNFSLGEIMPVGNIIVKDVDALTCGNVTALNTQQDITIAAGDDADKTWLGPGLGNVPLLMKAEMKGEALNAVLNIVMYAGMQVTVKLGDKASEIGQLPNSGFSDYHTATYSTSTSQEPNGWHSFMTASGSLAMVVAGTPHTFIANECAPSSKDGKSVQIKSGVVWNNSANGTITTGRLQAGSVIATNADNCSYSDPSKTDVDANGDPYYTVLNSKPDSIKAILKFHVGPRADSNKNSVYATISAIINDGTYVQDPEKSEYSSSIIARANNNKIASSNEAWQTISIPFTYTESTALPKAILVTMSTCAGAGEGSRSDSDPDILTVDSVALVYNANLTSLKVKGKELTAQDGAYYLESTDTYSADDIEVTTDGVGAYVSKKIDDVDGGISVTITVTSNDLKTANVYSLSIKGATSGVKKVVTDVPAGVTGIYNVNGQQVSDMSRQGIYIIKYSDGRVQKVVKK